MKPTSRNQTHLYSPGEKQRDKSEINSGHDITLCPDCSCVYYKKAWHHDLSNHKKLTDDHHAKIGRCPSCRCWRDHQWEGEVRIQNVPKDAREEMMHLIMHLSQTAFEKNPMHRVFDIATEKNMITIFVSENQLAQSIARKIHEAFKAHITKPVIHRGKEDSTLLATIEWK